MAKNIVKEIRNATRRKFTAEEKILARRAALKTRTLARYRASNTTAP